MNTLADKVLRPRSVAIVGASADLTKNNSRPQRYLRKHGFKGAVYPINPNHGEIAGEPCYPSLAATPAPADHAYVMVPARAVEGVIRECGAVGVAVATVFAGGFAEGGPEGRARQERLLAVAREAGVRLIGPNSLGVLNTNWPATISANAVLERDVLPRGRTGVVSQSGSMIGALVSRGQPRGIHFSTLVSIGNEIDLSVGEIAQMMVEDTDTDVVLLFLETLRDRDRIAAMARAAHAVGKPVLAYVLGASELGRSLAVSHTGALLGEGAALEAYLASCGILRLRTFEALIEAPALVRGRKPAGGRRVAIATTTGGAAALVADNLGTRGVEVVVPGEELRTRLAALGLEVPAAPIVDLTMAGTRPEVVETVMRGFLADDRVEAIVMAVGSSAETYPELVVKPLTAFARADKPVVAFLLPDAVRSLALLADAGIAGFRTPEACADALDAYLSWMAPRPAMTGELPDAAVCRVEGIAAAGRCNEHDALGLFAALGIATPAMTVIATGAPVPADLAYPVVAKVLSADLPHKSEAGGVVLGIADAAGLARAVDEIGTSMRRHAPMARIDGVLVQSQEKGLAEAIVGFRRDPLAGPVVVAGLGGLLAEVYRDFAVRSAPIDESEALSMIGEVKGMALLHGFRGQPRGDVAALARIVVALSRLALSGGDAVVEAEINPVIVKADGEGAVAVDGVVVLTPDRPRPGGA